MAAPQQQVATKKNLPFKEFGGVNTQAARQVIEDIEFAWLENVMPIGNGNLKSVPAPSTSLQTVPSTCYYMQEGNLNNVAYMFMFCTDGSAYQVLLTSPYTRTTVAAAGTFSGTLTRIAQWKNSNIVIIDTTAGFFDWNGSVLDVYKGTVQSVSITAAGIGFTNATTTTLTPSGGTPSVAATFTCTIGINLATNTTAGTNYAAGDVLTLVGGTFTSAATITVSSANAGTGAITGFNILSQGVYTIAPNPLTGITVIGGHGTGAIFTLVFGLVGVAVATPGSGYTSAPTIAIAGAGAGTGASVSVNMNTTATGTSIATYAGRMWVANGRTIYFSAPGTYNDFNPANLAGSVIMTDETLKSNITRLFSANTYLYIFGGGSINMISNVAVTNPTYSSTGAILTPATTIFSNQNLTPSVGTEMSFSVASYFRSVMFMVDYGVMALSGSTPQKISDPLDGIFPLFDFVSREPSCGEVVINGVLCMAYLVKYNDTAAGVRSLICVFFNKKWYFCSQGTNLTFAATGSPDSDIPGLYGTDGTNLYRLFSNAILPISQKIQTKLWDMGDSLYIKQAYKMALEFISSATGVINVSLDTETALFPLATSGLWVNTALTQGLWVNGAGVSGVWQTFLPASKSNYVVPASVGYSFTGQDATQFGNYLGLTVTSTIPGLTYMGMYLQYEARAQWVR